MRICRLQTGEMRPLCHFSNFQQASWALQSKQSASVFRNPLRPGHSNIFSAVLTYPAMHNDNSGYGLKQATH